jgi:hypothetical protein
MQNEEPYGEIGLSYFSILEKPLSRLTVLLSRLMRVSAWLLDFRAVVLILLYKSPNGLHC